MVADRKVRSGEWTGTLPSEGARRSRVQATAMQARDDVVSISPQPALPSSATPPAAKATSAAVARIARVPLREVWPHEATDFTVWLQDNLDVLNEVLDVELVSAEREQSAGAFSVDLVAEDDSGRSVVIENQLEKTDHDHLGKLLTYLAAFEADRAIWITADPRPEHVKAVAWLNDSTPADFHLLKVEAIRIDQSPPAPLLTSIVGPSIEGKRVAATKKEQGARHMAREEYWAHLLRLAKPQTTLFSTVGPTRYPYISTGAGVSGLSYQYWVRQDDARVVLWIDRGKEQDQANKAIFDHLVAQRADIESDYGSSLIWEAMPDARACKVVGEVPGAPGWRTPPEQREAGMLALVDAMTRMHRALAPRIAMLPRSWTEV
jgi:hypothetical protein